MIYLTDFLILRCSHTTKKHLQHLNALVMWSCNCCSHTTKKHPLVQNWERVWVLRKNLLLQTNTRNCLVTLKFSTPKVRIEYKCEFGGKTSCSILTLETVLSHEKLAPLVQKWERERERDMRKTSFSILILILSCHTTKYHTELVKGKYHRHYDGRWLYIWYGCSHKTKKHPLVPNCVWVWVLRNNLLHYTHTRICFAKRQKSISIQCAPLDTSDNFWKLYQLKEFSCSHTTKKHLRQSKEIVCLVKVGCSHTTN